MKLLYRNGIYFGGFVNLMSWLRFCLLVLGWSLLMISNFSLVIEFAKQAKKDQYPNEYELGEKKLLSIITPPIAEVLCVKNVRAIVVCGFLIK